MPSINFEHHTQFFTSTIFEREHVLKDDSYKQIIIDSLFVFKKGRQYSSKRFEFNYAKKY